MEINTRDSANFGAFQSRYGTEINFLHDRPGANIGNPLKFKRNSTQ